MIEISEIINIETNLVVFKVIDSLFILSRFEMCSLQVLYLDEWKFGSHEPLAYDRV